MRENNCGGESCGARLSGCHRGDISTRRARDGAARLPQPTNSHHPTAAGLSPGCGDTEHLGVGGGHCGEAGGEMSGWTWQHGTNQWQALGAKRHRSAAATSYKWQDGSFMSPSSWIVTWVVGHSTWKVVVVVTGVKLVEKCQGWTWHHGPQGLPQVGPKRSFHILQTAGWQLHATQQLDCHLGEGIQSTWEVVVMTKVKCQDGRGSTAPRACPRPVPRCWRSSLLTVWFWFPLRHPRLHPGDQNSWQGMRNKPGGQASPDGVNSTDCKLLTAFEFRAWSLLDSSTERCLGLLKAIYKRQSTIYAEKHNFFWKEPGDVRDEPV